MKQKQILVYAEPINELTKENKEKFINFTKNLDKYNAEKTLIKSSHLEKIRII
jgi:ABC-type molybdenum transport system ATPase subunit/photorepair protein PhrA